MDLKVTFDDMIIFNASAHNCLFDCRHLFVLRYEIMTNLPKIYRVFYWYYTLNLRYDCG